MVAAREVAFAREEWPFRIPLAITGRTFRTADVLVVTIREDGIVGRGEAAGVFYLGETADGILEQASSIRRELEAGMDRNALREALRPGGARNAIDCALWDLEVKREGRTVWEATGIQPGPTPTTLTVGIDSARGMAAAARRIDGWRIKVKLDDDQPVEKVAAIRDARPEASIIVDVNQGWTMRQLEQHAPRLRDLGVAMIEQPLPRGLDHELDDYQSPVPLCADESCLDVSEFPEAAGRYQLINIKLDKTGGLTEALELARLARESGNGVMVGSMMGTSLAMAPALVVAQLADYVDLDGPFFLERDRPESPLLEHGVLATPGPELWG